MDRKFGLLGRGIVEFDLGGLRRGDELPEIGQNIPVRISAATAVQQDLAAFDYGFSGTRIG